MVRHYHEVVQLELASQSVCPKHIDKKFGLVLASKNRRSMKVLHPAKNVRLPATILRRLDFRVSFTISSG